MIIKGDLTGDARINLDDFIIFKSYVIGAIDFTAEQLAAADINADGDVSVTDFSALMNHLLGVSAITDFVNEV